MGVGQCVCVSFSCAATAGPDLHQPCVTYRVIPAPPSFKTHHLDARDACCRCDSRLHVRGQYGCLLCAAAGRASRGAPPRQDRTTIACALVPQQVGAPRASDGGRQRSIGTGAVCGGGECRREGDVHFHQAVVRIHGDVHGDIHSAQNMSTLTQRNRLSCSRTDNRCRDSESTACMRIGIRWQWSSFSIRRSRILCS